MLKSIALYAPKIIFDLLGDVLYFLPWWYSKGIIRVATLVWRSIRAKERELAIAVWVKHITKPLHDDYGWRKRIKSVILRISHICIRSAILAVWISMLSIGLMVYVTLPPLVLWQIVYQLL